MSEKFIVVGEDDSEERPDVSVAHYIAEGVVTFALDAYLTGLASGAMTALRNYAGMEEEEATKVGRRIADCFMESDDVMETILKQVEEAYRTSKETDHGDAALDGESR